MGTGLPSARSFMDAVAGDEAAEVVGGRAGALMDEASEKAGEAQAMQKAQKALLSKVSWQQVDVRGNLRRFVFSFLSFYL